MRWVSVPTGASTVATTSVPWLSISRAACRPMAAVPAALSMLNRLTVHHEGVRRSVGQVGQHGVARLDLLDGHLIDGVAVGGLDDGDAANAGSMHRRVTPTRRSFAVVMVSRSVKDLWRIFGAVRCPVRLCQPTPKTRRKLCLAWSFRGCAVRVSNPGPAD
jgi:hypothetical protein